tara:strand:+ start:789 stop:989 length:201 start_codon:yes stop_codon:yes gene_type:complete
MALDRQVTLAIAGTAIGAVAFISYNWASWATETLIAVDKRTEVMSIQIDYIANEMGVSYGYLSGKE